jgi:hypothetical protein
MMLRLLNPQGIFGIAVALILAALLGAAKIDVRHYKKASARFEQLYRAEVYAHAQSAAAVRAATDRARAEDAANLARVELGQSAISERSAHDFEARLAAARARAAKFESGRLRDLSPPRAADGGGRSAPLPGLSAPAAGTDQAPGKDRLPAPALSESDALIATEQAIQLDELIKWVRAQAAVDTGNRR